MATKRLHGQEPIKLLDTRDLLSRFRSKRDLYDYLDKTSKTIFIMMHVPIVQLYCPPIQSMNKDFLKQILADKKKLIPRTQLRPIVVPNYDELSVKNLWNDVREDPELNVFFWHTEKPNKLPPREFFFNVVNTLHPEYLDQVIRHAQS
jgi:hypothetical protein